jgi:hypothetical protein
MEKVSSLAINKLEGAIGTGGAMCKSEGATAPLDFALFLKNFF